MALTINNYLLVIILVLSDHIKNSTRVNDAYRTFIRLKCLITLLT